MADAVPGTTGAELRAKHAIVTGGGTGIGAAIATLLSQRGANVTLIGRRLDVLQQQADKLVNTQAISCDLTQPELVRVAFAEAIAEFGPIDILINNAGRADTAPFHKLDDEKWRQMLDVNLNSVFTCTQIAYPTMKTRGWGRIINIASTAALKGYAYVSAYCAAKHAVVGLTKALALEAATSGVTVNAICPGYTDTDIVSNAVQAIAAKTGRTVEQALQEFTAANPQGRLIQPFEVANTVLWLCLPGAESITGQSIAIAGGEVM
jgi:NAD(P)-dependent dehydrogenase (short-subunit alcohol dehydrogenase family)